MHKRLIIIGGGAAGFFAAGNIPLQSKLQITLLEQQQKLLSKVKISGGGRCNVTHACYDVTSLTNCYPRGKEYLGSAFATFGVKDTIRWFEQRGVPLKTEGDGRIFPKSDRSQSIIDCLVCEAKKRDISIITNTKVLDIQFTSGLYQIITVDRKFAAEFLLIAPGASKLIWKILEKMGHNVIPGVPSLFTFKISDERLEGLAGLSVDTADIKITECGYQGSGPLLITHWGLSGPVILKGSSFAAICLNELDYRFEVTIDWVPSIDQEQFEKIISEAGKKYPSNTNFRIPKRLQKSLLEHLKIPERYWAEIGKKDKKRCWKALKASTFKVTGKSTFKEEFVTAGGIDMEEVNLSSFESKKFPNMYFAGEVLNVDAITGGYNFQNAWTGAWLVARSIHEKL